MSNRRVLVAIALVVLAPVWGAVVVSAAPVENDTYAVAQGTTCTVIQPVTNESQTAEAFYDYRNPNTEPNSSTFSSFGTTEYQETSTSTLLFYEGSEGASIVLVHDELGDEDGGSTLTMAFEGLPADGAWVVEDDQYSGRDDDWVLGNTTATIDWLWGPNRTDGGVYRGIGNASGPIVITPGFNEDATYWGDWGYSGSDAYRIDAWRLIGADGSTTLLDRGRRLFIHGGGCEATPPTAALSGPTSADTGETITLDAGGTTDDGTIGGYEWDFDADGEIDEVTAGPTTDHAFEERGTQTVAVTAFDTYGNGDTADLQVNVTVPATPPNASLDTPASATVNESVTLDASNSTDEGEIIGYEWDADGDGTLDGSTTDPVLEYTYNDTGTVDPTVTVVDDDNETATATASIEIQPPNQPPTAALDAPATVRVDQPVTFDASGSTDDRGIETYRWDFDGDGTVDATTATPTVEHTFANTSSAVEASVTVVDSAGLNDTASVTLDILPNSPPNASLDAPANVTVGAPATFDASGSTDDDGIERYRWDFDGDGTIDATTATPTAEHTYQSLGSVNVTVTVVDTANQTGTASVSVQVRPDTTPPSASLSVPEVATVGQSVSFDASNSTDDGTITAFRWDFDGNGEIDAETQVATIEYAYNESGEFQPAVTVVDGDDQNSTTSATIAVGDPAAATPAIDVDTADPTAGEPVAFNANNATAATPIVSYDWVFGDGANGTGATVDHVYTEAGEYEVTLTITTEGGVTANATTTVSVAAADGGGDGGNNGGGSNDGGNNDGGTDDDSNDGGTDDGDDSGGNTGGQSGGTSGGQSGTEQSTAEPEPDPEPDIGQANVTLGTQELLVGETLVAEASVANHGNASGTKTVEFEVEGEILESRQIPLAPGENRTVSFSHQFTSPGTKAVEVDQGKTWQVEVRPREPNISVASLTVDEPEVEPGEQFTIVANVTNTGDAPGERTVSLELFGEAVATKNVSLAVGDTASLTFTRSVVAAGSYDATVGNETVQVTVVGDTATAQPPTTTTEGPGLGALSALAALLAVAAALRRRRR